MASSGIISYHKKNLIAKASKYENLSQFIERVQSTPDDEFLETFGYLLLNNSKQVASMLEMLDRRALYSDYFMPTEDESHPKQVSPFQAARQSNKDWFKAHGNSAKINDGIRQRFASLSISHQALFAVIQNTVKHHYDLELNDIIIHEIQSLTLNHEINLIHFDIDPLCDVMLDGMYSDPQWIIDNILEKDIIDLSDKTCFLNTLIDNKLYSNYNNVTNMNKADLKYWAHSNQELINNQFNVGDIFVLMSDSIHSVFSYCVYIMDDNHQLHKIGIQRFGSYHGNLHLIIPVFITRHLYDPIRAYSALIHQHTFEGGGSTIELELQIDHSSHVFDPRYKTLSEEQEKYLVKTFKWKQRHHDGGRERPKDLVKQMVMNEYNRYNFSTVYVVTDMGFGGSLIGYCNHSCVDKINLSKYTVNAEREGNGYVVHYAEKKEVQDKIFSDDTFDLLVSGYWRNNLLSCIPSVIIGAIQQWIQPQQIWECNKGLAIRNGTSIRYTAKSTYPSDDDESDYDAQLSWLYATSLSVFKKDVVRFDVSIRKDNGGICMGIMDTKNIYKIHDLQIMDRKLSTFCYRTTGEFLLNGHQISKSFKDLSGTTNIIRLVLDFTQGKLLWIKKTRTRSRDGSCQLKIEKQREFPMAIDTTYKFFVGMCWNNDSVVATWS